MQKRRIGHSELEIAPLMLGTNTFGWSADSETSFAILDAFVEAGYDAIDTADVYSCWVPGHVGGESETIIGNWLKARGKRDRVVVATKVGGPMPGWGEGLSASYIIKAAEGSLTRLQTDYIDLYQSHTDELRTPLDETLEAYDRLIKSGKVRAIGASHYDARRLSEALLISQDKGLCRYDSLQPRYNLFDRAEFETTVQDVCVENDVGVIPYSVLAKGFLTGKYRPGMDNSESKWEGMVEQRYVNDRGLRILTALDEIAEEQDATPAEVALAWIVAQPGIVAPIIGVRSVAQLRDFLDFGRLKLDRRQLDVLSTASAP
jgi:aryl-alcohol dehydrogenase-like predicted oxidoreductase